MSSGNKGTGCGLKNSKFLKSTSTRLRQAQPGGSGQRQIPKRERFISNFKSSNLQYLTIIVAIDENNAIGVGGNLPWHLPQDLKFFKNTTWAMPVIMGRKTFESIPEIAKLNLTTKNTCNIDLGALSRNVFYMIYRNEITQNFD